MRDCLLLNWTLPADLLPAAPAPLRYELLRGSGERQVMVTALLFYHEGVRLASLPFVRFSYPQFCLAAAVLDGDGQPALLFRQVLAPMWVVVATRLVVQQPLIPARLHFDRPSRQLEAEGWCWQIQQGTSSLRLDAQQSTPTLGMSSLFPSWRMAVDYFRQRRRAYYQGRRGLRCVETFYLPRVDAWPMSVNVVDPGLLQHCLPLPEAEGWARPHSSMLFPDLPLSFELSLVPAMALPRPLPQPAAACLQPLLEAARVRHGTVQLA